MKVGKFVTLLFAGMSSLMAPQLYSEEMEPNPEATEEARMAAASEKLNKEADIVVIYAKGLCCPSCAIGVRKMVSRLDYVDRKRFNNGVDLDTKTQLITVAITESKKVDLDSFSKAIFEAGYDPVRSYQLKKGKLLHTPLTMDN